MKITNKNKLPKPFVDAVSKDYKYREKRYSVTTLLKPIREIMLMRRYGEEIEQDVSEMIWAIFGTACHSILENSGDAKHLLKEKSLEMKFGDYTLSGRSDLYNTASGCVVDYKVCSTFKVLKKDFEDYRKQGLMYALMLKNMGYKVKKAQFILVLRDWQKTKAKFDKTYPQSQVVKKEFKFTEKDFEDIYQWISDKFKEIAIAEKQQDSDLPLCSQEDRWNSGQTFAVMKNGRKTALRVLSTREEAEEYQEKNGGDYIQERQGEDRKCKEYCSCCYFCDYYKNFVKNDSAQALPF